MQEECGHSVVFTDLYVNLLQTAPNPPHVRSHREAWILLPLGSRKNVRAGSSLGPTKACSRYSLRLAVAQGGGRRDSPILCFGGWVSLCVSCGAVLGIGL